MADPNDTGYEQPDLSAEVPLDEVAAAKAEFLKGPAGHVTSTPDEPVLDDEAAALDELTKPPAGEAAPPSTTAGEPPAADPYAQYGGAEAVAHAFEVQEALRTESGVRLLIQQGLQALGYTPAQIKAAVGGGPGAPTAEPAPDQPSADPYADLPDEELLTGADFKRYAEKIKTDAIAEAQRTVASQVDPVVAQQREAFNAEIRTRNDATLAELLGPVPAEPEKQGEYSTQAQQVLDAAGRYVDPSNYDPAHIRSAIIKGHADVEAQNEARWKAYLGKKKAARSAAPSNIGGASAGEGEPKEPQNLKEAREAMKAAGLWG